MTGYPSFDGGVFGANKFIWRQFSLYVCHEGWVISISLSFPWRQTAPNESAIKFSQWSGSSGGY